jgi:branched-chain amino acid transport system substrate-binding protein
MAMMKTWLIRVALMFAAMLNAGAAIADEAAPIKIGTALDFSVLYTHLVPVYSQGQRDYASLINGRGGIKGHPLELIIVDQRNDVQLGLDAYQRFKREGAVLVDFLSTPVSRAVLPLALADGMNVITLFHGRADAADGRVFPTIFPMVATYWSQAADLIKYIGDQEKELIKGKRIALVAIDNPLGHEVEPIFQALAKRLEFRFEAFFYPPPGTDQGVAWKQARRFGPDWTLIWGAGDAQAHSIVEALAEGFKLDHVASNVSIAETDLDLAGRERAAGLLRFEGVASGRDIPIIAAIEKEVIAAGKGAGPPERVGQTYYNAGVASMVLAAEGARLALENDGEPLTPAKFKKGLERLRDFSADDLLPPTTITARDHQGGGRGRVVQWDGTKWLERRHWFAAYQDIVWDLIAKSSATFKAAPR